MDFINWFSNVELALHTWNKSYFIVVCNFIIIIIIIIIDFREKERKGEREKHQLIVAHIYAFIGCFFYVPWQGIKPTTLAYPDNTFMNRATQPGHNFFSSFSILIVTPRTSISPSHQIKLTQEGKDLYSENYKSLEKEIEEDTYTKWKDISCSWNRKINIIKMSVLPKTMHSFSAMLLKYQ